MMNEGMLRIEKPGRLYALITSSTAARNAASTRRAENRALAHYVHNSRCCPRGGCVEQLRRCRLGRRARLVPQSGVARFRQWERQRGCREDRGRIGLPPPAAMSGRMSWSIERQRSSIAARATPSSNSSSSFSYDSTDSGRPNRPVLCDAMRCGATPRRHRTDDPSWPSKGSVAQQAWG